MDDSLLFEIMNMDIVKKYNFCCLCGKQKNNHNNISHHYYSAIDEYRCKKCNKFFFEHDHIKNPCFIPYKYLN